MAADLFYIHLLACGEDVFVLGHRNANSLVMPSRVGENEVITACYTQVSWGEAVMDCTEE